MLRRTAGLLALWALLMLLPTSAQTRPTATIEEIGFSQRIWTDRSGQQLRGTSVRASLELPLTETAPAELVDCLQSATVLRNHGLPDSVSKTADLPSMIRLPEGICGSPSPGLRAQAPPGPDAVHWPHDSLVCVELRFRDHCLRQLADSQDSRERLARLQLQALALLELLLELPEQALQLGLASPAALARGDTPPLAPVRAFTGCQSQQTPVWTAHGRPSDADRPDVNTVFAGLALVHQNLTSVGTPLRHLTDEPQEAENPSEDVSVLLSIANLGLELRPGASPLSEALLRARNRRWSGSATFAARTQLWPVLQTLRLLPPETSETDSGSGSGDWRVEFQELNVSQAPLSAEDHRYLTLEAFPEAFRVELEVPDQLGVRMTRVLRGEGFHRRLHTSIRLSPAAASLVAAQPNCRLELSELLSSGAYVDVYELEAELRRRPESAGLQVQLYTPPNVESPTSMSSQLWLQLSTPAHGSLELDIPVHFRYRAAVDSGQSTLQATSIYPPLGVRLSCGDTQAVHLPLLEYSASVEPRHSSSNNNNNISSNSQDPETDPDLLSRSFQVLRMWQPVGDLGLLSLVSVGTAVISLAVMLLISVVTCLKKD